MLYNLGLDSRIVKKMVDQSRIAEEDPRGLIGRHMERGIVIDEAQRVPDLFSYVQTIVDEHRTIGKVILSGSWRHLPEWADIVSR